jgi:hypothetical protein
MDFARQLEEAAGKLPPPFKVTEKSVRDQVSLYWSPRQGKLDPTMMGSSMATDVLPQVIRSFEFDAANAFYHSKWNKAQGEDFKVFVEQVMGSAGKTIGWNLSLSIYNRARGNDYWHRVFDLKDLDEAAKVLQNGGVRGAEERGITPEQQKRVGDWLARYVKTVAGYEHKLHKSLVARVTRLAQPIIEKGNAGVEP